MGRVLTNVGCVLALASGMALAQADSPPPPALDRSRASVPLEAVVFDTFGGPPLPLSRASAAQIEQLRDRIRPIYAPRYARAEDGDWLRGDDLVLGYALEERAFAYPLKMLNYHEIVNDVIGGVPLLISYCPLCASAAVYDRRVGERVMTFGNTSALYQNDMVMYDHETGSYWFQVGGEAVVGTLTGQRLRLLPSVTATWSAWQRDHPATLILARDQGFGFEYPYEHDAFADYPRMVADGRFPFPVDTARVGDSLPLAEIVVTAELGDAARVYAVDHIAHGVVNDRIGDLPIAVLADRARVFARVVVRRAGDRVLTLRRRDGRYEDLETGSIWDMAGHAVSGALRGARLAPVASRRGFWFSVSIALPHADVWHRPAP